MTARRPWLIPLTAFAAAACAGVLAGIGAAGIVLALYGQPVLGASTEQVETVLVACPLAGVGGMAALALAAARSADWRAVAPRALALWCVAAVGATLAAGLRAFLM